MSDSFCLTLIQARHLGDFLCLALIQARCLRQVSLCDTNLLYEFFAFRDIFFLLFLSASICYDKQGSKAEGTKHLLWKNYYVEAKQQKENAMLKKVYALILAGAMTIAGCIHVFAADEADETGNANKTSSFLDSFVSDASLDKILNSLGSEEGDISGLLGSLGLDDLAGQLTGGDGSLDLGALLQEAALGDLSKEDLAGVIAALKDPESLKGMLDGLFAKDGLGTTILDKLGSDDNAIGSVVKSLKGADGTYDVEKIEQIMESVGNAVENGSGIVINGTELSAEDIQNAAAKVIGLFAGN